MEHEFANLSTFLMAFAIGPLNEDTQHGVLLQWPVFAFVAHHRSRYVKLKFAILGQLPLQTASRFHLHVAAVPALVGLLNACAKDQTWDQHTHPYLTLPFQM